MFYGCLSKVSKSVFNGTPILNKKVTTDRSVEDTTTKPLNMVIQKPVE